MRNFLVLAALALASPAWGGCLSFDLGVPADSPPLITGDVPKGGGGRNSAPPYCPADYALFAVTGGDIRGFEHVLYVWPEGTWTLVCARDLKEAK